MRTVVAAVHGIGFAKAGDLQPMLDGLTLGPDQVTIDANWNDIAAKGYQSHIDFTQLKKLARALEATASIRPPSTAGPARANAWEIMVDLADLFFTTPLWGLGILLTLLVTAPFEVIHGVPGPTELLHLTDIYLALYAAFAGAVAVSTGIALLCGARPVLVARLFHVLIAAIRPWLILSYGWLVMTRWRGGVDWRWSLLIAAACIGATLALLDFFDAAYGPKLIGSLALLLLYAVGPFLVAHMLAPGLKLMLDVFLYVSDGRYRASIQNGLAGKILAAKGDVQAARLVLIGHSLGSVIAADAVVRGKLDGHFHSICLVTAGSPIRRFFQRIFPGHILPATATALVQGRPSNPSFRWGNYYRRFDIVGGRLALPVDQACVERRSLRIADPLSSHIDYWKEARFSDFITEIAAEARSRAD